MNMAFRSIVLLLGMAAILGGCSKGGAATPKDAVANLSKSYEKGDRALYLASVEVGPDGQELAGALFDLTVAMKGYRSDMEKAYGKGAGGSRRDSGVLTEEELSKLEIKEEGDKATVKSPEGGEPLKLVKRDGAWRVDMTHMTPPADIRQRMIESMKARAKAVGEVRAKIGQPGMTKEKIGQEFLRAMVGGDMGGRIPTPPAP